MSIDQVPRDILSDILRNPKLSTEDIARCAFVCKSWYSLVTSPAFVSLHSTQPRFDPISNNNKNGLFLVIENKKKYSLNLDDDSLSEYKMLEFPLKNPNNFKIVDCLNGVVCLSGDHENIVLWNPSVRKLLELPKPFVPLDSYRYRSIGFGYDAATNDFKVVRALNFSDENSCKAEAEVYESSVGRWRRINNKLEAMDWSTSCCFIGQLSNQAFLNGIVHRVGSRSHPKSNKGIVSFDFRNEAFGKMDVPADLSTPRGCAMYDLRVSVIAGESLSLIVCHKFHVPSETCSIWVMKEYGVANSWTKLFNVSISNSTRGILPLEIILTRWNVEPLVKKWDEPALYSYVPDTKLVHPLEWFRSYKNVVFNFTESLALLGVKGGGKHGTKIDVAVRKKKMRI